MRPCDRLTHIEGTSNDTLSLSHRNAFQILLSYFLSLIFSTIHSMHLLSVFLLHKASVNRLRRSWFGNQVDLLLPILDPSPCRRHLSLSHYHTGLHLESSSPSSFLSSFPLSVDLLFCIPSQGPVNRA